MKVWYVKNNDEQWQKSLFITNESVDDAIQKLPPIQIFIAISDVEFVVRSSSTEWVWHYKLMDA